MTESQSAILEYLEDEMFLDTKQVEELTGIPAATLRYYRSTNQGPKSFKLGSRAVRYKQEDVEAWIEQQYESTARGGGDAA